MNSSRKNVRILLPLGCCLLVLLAAPSVRAEDDIDEEEPTPSSVKEILSPMDRLGRLKIPRPGFFPWVKEKLQEYPPFLRDTTLELKARTYYLRTSKYDNTTSEALAMGGALVYKSGWLYDRLRVGAAYYTSQPVYAPAGSDGSGLLAPGQKGYSVLGQAYGQIKLAEDTVLNLYRYGEYDTPYISRNDGKVSPYTYEGYTVVGKLGGTGDRPQLNYGGGYILKIKDKTAENFVWMSEKAGTKAQRGVAAAGARYSGGGLSVAAMDYYCDDIINIGYAETTYTAGINEDLGVRLAVQFTDQRSVGSDLLKGHAFATNQAGVKANVSYKHGILTLAYTANDSGADLVNPWSGYPGYTGAMVTNYSKAGVNAVSAKVSYEFGRIGMPGVAAYAVYAHGWGMVSPTSKAALPNENEYDVDLQWLPKFPLLDGLWFRVRYGVVHQYQGHELYTHDFRMNVNYDFPLM